MKRLLPLALTSLVAACSHTPPASNDDGSTSLFDSDGGGFPLPDGLYGTAPAKNLAAPEFTATNSDNTERHRGNLIGAPHVLWFFPLSGTAG